MRTLLRLGTLVLLTGLAGCGPAPSAAGPTSPAPAVPGPAPAQVAATAPLDLSPVPEPVDIVGLARWTSPAATISALSGCAGLPPALAEGNARLVVEETLKELLPDAIDEKQLGLVVALDAPIHAVVTLDPTAKRGRPLMAVAIGLTSLERARGAAEGAGPLTELSPGIWKISGKDRSGGSCAVAASAGATPARLVCGDRDRDVVALAPYLTRTLPAARPEGRDIRGELRIVPITNKFGGVARQQLRGLPILAQSQLSIGEPKFDKALVTAATAVQDELGALLGDADKVNLELGVDPRACLTLSATAQLKGKASWLAGTIADQGRRTGPPPALFWRAPKDSETAFYANGGDGTRATEIFKALSDLLEGFLNKENVGKPADRKALADLLRNLPVSKDVPSVSAGGHLDAAKGKADKGGAQAMLDDLLGNWMGWNLIGVGEPADRTVKYLKDVVAAYNRPGLLGALKKELKDDAKLLPVVKTVAAPRDLGKGGLAVEMKFKDIPAPDSDPLGPGAAKAAKPKNLTFTFHLLVMSEDATTWIAFGPDKAELLRRLAVVKAGAPDSGTLATKAGLETLKNAKAISGGFMTISPITRSVGSAMGMVLGTAPMGAPPEVRQMMNLLGNLPHKGEGPIFFTAQAKGGSAPRGEVTVNMTKPALEDMGAILVGALKLAGAFSP